MLLLQINYIIIKINQINHLNNLIKKINKNKIINNKWMDKY